MIEIEITKEPVELYKILKFESLVASGGEAKMVIANGLVSVNGQIETRKRKKIVSGDTIKFGGEEFSIKFNSTPTPTADLSTTVVDVVTKAIPKIKNKPELNLSTSSKKQLTKKKSVKKNLSKKHSLKKHSPKKHSPKKQSVKK